MPSPTQFNQALFQQGLLKIAYRKAAQESLKNNGQVGFDIRGRAIYDLYLDKEESFEDLRELLIELKIPLPAKLELNSALQLLNASIGRQITFPIRCNLDLCSDLANREIQANIETLNDCIHNVSFENHRQRMSIIPLYEELLANMDHHHAAVKKRMGQLFKNRLPKKVKTAIEVAFTYAKYDIQTEVKKIARSLPKNLSVKEINQQLDQARATLHEEIKTQWFNTFKIQLDSLEPDHKRYVYSALIDDTFKRIYQEIPAHSYDIFGTDFANGTVSYITNSKDMTAHNKGSWKYGESALRFMIRNHLSDKGEVVLRPNGQISARVPSVACVASDDTSIEVKNDIGNIVEIYKQFHLEFGKIADSKEEKGSENKAIVYNLLTSLESHVEEKGDRKNFQNASARRILEASHHYNQQAIDTGKYLWVQNLSVNRHSNDLNGFFASPLENEAKLMADMSMLYTLQENLNFPELKDTYNAVLQQYQQFLRSYPTPSNFYKSKQGKEVSKLIKNFKKNFTLETPVESNLLHKANLALLKMYKNNYHYNKDYGSLIQALSIFVEQKSVAGCKSANERHEDVQKRVGLLIGLEGKNQMPPDLFRAFVNFNKNRKAKPAELDKVIARLVNETRMNGDENSISHSDQAGPSKLQVIATSFARGIWNLGKSILGLGIFSSVGLGVTILVLTALGMVFPPIDIALAISMGVVGIGVVSAPIARLWPLAKVCLSLGTVSTIGIGIGMAIMAGLGMGCPPLGLALTISAFGVIGLGMLASTTGAFVFKAKNTNYACSPEMVNNVNANASSLQSSHGIKPILKAVNAELTRLRDEKPPKSAKAMAKLGKNQTKKNDRPNSDVLNSPSPVKRKPSRRKQGEAREFKGSFSPSSL